MMFMMMGETMTQLTAAITSFALVYAAIRQYLPHQLMPFISLYANKIVEFVWPYVHINFHEYSGDSFRRSKLYEDIQTYLSANSTTRAQKLKAHDVNDSKSMVISLDDNSEVTDEFKGVKLWWTSHKRSPVNSSSWWGYPNSDEKRNFSLSFHRRHRELITTGYLNHVVQQGKEIAIKNRKRKLYTNTSKENYNRGGGTFTNWIGVEFEHPATFDTLALEPMLKQEIKNDLLKFKTGRDFYSKVGKPWKRGYLLYGPPGTGKSTMISAMANFLDYDIYDLELTSVKDNTELRKLFIDSSNKSIMVIEDIDCSLDLTRQRKMKKEEDEESKDPASKMVKKEDEKQSKVTLSGLLNFIDGIWSGCGGERLIVFTTNYIDKLDPALIRRGRMDMHVELSYCCFEAFKVLAKNYLDVESHDLFPTIEHLLGETDMTPADVTENLMPKSDTDDADHCLKKLIQALEKGKEDAIRKKAEEEAKLKAEEEAKLKAADEEKLEKESQGNSAKTEGVKCNGTLAKEVKENGSVTT